jgi:Nickel responsive protein SCO4226-like
MFIVERYLPAVRHGELAAAVDHDQRAAEGMTAAGIPVRHLSTIYVPSDESCFSLFDAPSADALREAQERAGIGFERIVEAVQLPPQDQARTGSPCPPYRAPVISQGDSGARNAP